MKPLIRSLIAGISISASLIATAQPAFAWGDREQGILAGVAATVLWNKLNERSHAQPAVHPVAPARVIHHHPPHRVMAYKEPVIIYSTPANCREIPVKDAGGQIIEIRRLCEQ